MKKEDINQAHFKAPLVSATDKPSIDFKNIEEDTFYQNSEVFPPRGSFINIPEDVLFDSAAYYLQIENFNTNQILEKKIFE